MRIRALLILSFFLCGRSLFADLKVVTTTEDLASITRSIGGELVKVTSIAKGIQDPHYVEAKPSYLVGLSRADLVVSIGLALESGWLPLLLRGARRPNLLMGNPGFLDVSTAINPIEVNLSADRSEGDVHPFGNPHYMADPERGLLVAEKIASRLKELDPSNSRKFEAQYQAYAKGLRQNIFQWKHRLSKFKGTKVIGYHKTFNYFFVSFDFLPIGFIEPKPGIPPTAQHVLSLIELAKKEKVKLILMENFFDPKPARTIAEKTGAKLLILPAYTGGEEKCSTYEAWLECLVSALEKELLT